MQAAKNIVNPPVYNEVTIERISIKPIVQSSRYLDPVRIEVPAMDFRPLYNPVNSGLEQTISPSDYSLE